MHFIEIRIAAFYVSWFDKDNSSLAQLLLQTPLWIPGIGHERRWRGLGVGCRPPYPTSARQIPWPSFWPRVRVWQPVRESMKQMQVCGLGLTRCCHLFRSTCEITMTRSFLLAHSLHRRSCWQSHGFTSPAKASKSSTSLPWITAEGNLHTCYAHLAIAFPPQRLLCGCRCQNAAGNLPEVLQRAVLSH